MLRRKAYENLLEWKKTKQNETLLIKGARQIGKTFLVRQFGQNEYKSFIEINFLKNPDFKAIFEGELTADEIYKRISAHIPSVKLINGSTLIFLDEIQKCSRARTSLKFLAEDNRYDIICSGSLLGLHYGQDDDKEVEEVESIPVGFERQLVMYSMDFREFLWAYGYSDEDIAYLKSFFDERKKIPVDILQKFQAILKEYIVVGGMPEVVSTWVSTHSYEECQSVQKEIVYTYEVDFAKYKKRANTTLLRLTLHSAAHQIGSKFVYSKVSRDFRSVQIKEALSLLTLAGLLIPVYNTAANGFPLGAEADESCAKYLFLDSGLLLSILGMDLGSITTLSEQILIGNATDLVNKGHITEMVAGLEIIKNMPPDSIPSLFFWMRSAKSSLAEVDYVMAKNMKILPIEVKAEVRGGMKSLYAFMETKHINHAIRTSLENFGSFTKDNGKINIYPLYALRSLVIMK